MDEKECKYKEIAHHTEECRLYNYNRGEGLNLSIDCNNNPNCMFKQLQTAKEQLSIAKEALSSIDKMYYSYSDGFNNIEKALLCCKRIASQALAKIEEVKC